MSATMLAAGTTAELARKASKLPYRTGEFYGPPGYNSTSASWTLNRMYLLPWYIGTAQVWNGIGIYSAAGVASAAPRLGIYADNAGVPGDLIGDYGTVDCSTAGDKIAVISPSLTRGGWVWLAVAIQGALAHVFNHAYSWENLGGTLSAYQASGRFVGAVSGALPASAAAAVLGSNLSPRPALRAA